MNELIQFHNAKKFKVAIFKITPSHELVHLTSILKDFNHNFIIVQLDSGLIWKTKWRKQVKNKRKTR